MGKRGTGGGGVKAMMKQRGVGHGEERGTLSEDDERGGHLFSPWVTLSFFPSVMQVAMAMALIAVVLLMPVFCVHSGRPMGWASRPGPMFGTVGDETSVQEVGLGGGELGGGELGGGGGGGGGGGRNVFGPGEGQDGSKELRNAMLERRESGTMTPSGGGVSHSRSRYSRSFFAMSVVQWAWKKTKGDGPDGKEDLRTVADRLFAFSSLLPLVQRAMEAQRDTKLVIESVLITEIGGHQSRKLLQEQSSLELRGGDGVSADIPESLPSTLPPGLSLPSPAVVESIAAGAKFNSSDFNLTGLVNGSLDEAAARDALTNLAANPSVFGGNSTNGSLSLDGLADMDFSTTQETKPFERLAENQTDRPDPRNKFRKYTGGWDFRNASYLSSVAYTAAPAFIIAVLWALLAVVYLFAIICYCCCCKRNRHAKFYESSAYCWPLVLVVLLTFTALGGSAILYTGAGKMHTELGLTIDYILKEVNKTTTKVRLAADDLVSMTNFSIAGAQMTSADQVKVMDATNEMYKAANDVDTAVEDNKKDIRRVVDLIRLIMNIVVGVTAGLVILGLVFTLLAWKYCIRVLAILGWVLIFVTWVLAGVYIVVMNVTDDTCLAMEEWTHDVSANTSISDILPCVDKNTANRTLLKSKSVVLFGTQLINNGIVVTNSLPVPAAAPAVPLLCAPYTNDLQVVPIETCLAQEPERTNFVEYEEDWRKHTCPLSPDYLSACQQPEPAMNCFFSNCSDRRLTVPTYLKLVESTWMLVKINSTTHMLVELMQCQFAVKIFTDVNNNFCHKLQVQAKLQWIGLIVLSSSSMLLVFLWQLYVHRWNKRMRTTSKPIYDSHAQSYG